MRILLALALFLQTGRQVDVTVNDTQGLTIEGARITVTEQQGTLRKTAVSTADGARIENLNAAVYDVRIDANGFATKTVTADLRTQNSASLKVDLELAKLTEERVSVITRTEEVLGDMPASATVLRAEEIEQSPAVAADDIFRQVPTFSLFRRTSSLAAHPTAQGVSLRGVGPSGVSRTLVMIDNVPFNDPFGGWVYWTRVPLASVERIEVVDGASSSLYGNYAMGGVINIISGRPARRSAELTTQYGNLNSPKLDFRGSDVWGKVGASIDGGWFNPDGFPIVAAGERGPVDTKA